MTAITEYVQLDKSAPNDKKSANSIKKKKKKERPPAVSHSSSQRRCLFNSQSCITLHYYTSHNGSVTETELP